MLSCLVAPTDHEKSPGSYQPRGTGKLSGPSKPAAEPLAESSAPQFPFLESGVPKRYDPEVTSMG